MASQEASLKAAASSSSSDVNVSPASPVSAADAAKARREARKAKILGSGSDRLARITKTGRGAEAEALYPSNPPLSSASEAAAAASTARLATDDPDDVDISRLERPDGARAPIDDERMQTLVGLGQQDMPQDPFQQMMMMMSGQLGSGAAESGGGPSGMPFDLNAMLGGAQGGGGGGSGAMPNLSGLFGPQGMVVPSPRSRLDKLFDLLHLVAMLILGFITVSAVFTQPSAEKSMVIASSEGEGAQILWDEQAGLQRWARLAYERPGDWETHFFAIAEHLPLQGVPVFWLFMSIEILLQSARMLVLKDRPQSGSLLASLARQIPIPTLQIALRTGGRYLSLLTAFLDDLSVLVLVLGLTIMYSAWKTGDPVAAIR
ncbi:hypothetical protein K437DRAFT_294667 [Tilletiaria anomala UBC 951]|uniref:GET complex, subunit GET2 n=1 Tax=Tilletiaria anomala (strain ATCC 24038 / CBS 436.72 / UBC 951) TaxID=1037660 RepID=A0A066VUC7_TILAU|nr:uncharacterized protein K437DRAFT_294667 [Tilletiaria anomala UBC 951]KDN45106.1 hypothetical protein K437DRAFT_294667 [Tilletiaria anomala UBC 951]